MVDERFELSDPALTLRHWQAVVTFGHPAVRKILAQPRWVVKHLDVLQKTQSKDLRTQFDVILPGEMILEMAAQPECLDDYYADPDGQRLYAVARRRKWEEPSSAETDGLLKIPDTEALLSYGAFCLFMASDRSIGYRRERDLLRFANEPENIPAKTKLLWTMDERGMNLIQENQPWDSFRGIVSHRNLSQQAYLGGEAWRTGENELTLNAASRDFGYNRDFPQAVLDEAEQRYRAVIDHLVKQKLNVTARPWGTR